MNDLRKITSKIKMDHLEQPVRIWTDYERFNRTHFWSKTANEWWQNVDHGGQGSTHCSVRVGRCELVRYFPIIIGAGAVRVF